MKNRTRGLAHVENAIEIARSPEDVFDYSVDLEREPPPGPGSSNCCSCAGTFLVASPTSNALKATAEQLTLEHANRTAWPDVARAGGSSLRALAGSSPLIAACPATPPRRAISRGRGCARRDGLGDHPAAPADNHLRRPDYAAQLARILSEAGRAEEAREWRAQAAARYDELLARHPEAFADHAAEFWLQSGTDPDRALSLATMNLEVRRTPRARELLSRATSAVDGGRPGIAHPGSR